MPVTVSRFNFILFIFTLPLCISQYGDFYVFLNFLIWSIWKWLWLQLIEIAIISVLLFWKHLLYFRNSRWRWMFPLFLIWNLKYLLFGLLNNEISLLIMCARVWLNGFPIRVFLFHFQIAYLWYKCVNPLFAVIPCSGTLYIRTKHQGWSSFKS